MRREALSIRASLFLSSFLTFAGPQIAVAEDETESTLLDTIFVSATGTAVDPLTAPASVTVITSEDLEKGEFVDLTDALSAVPGVSVAGAADGENIFIRGLPSEYTLILVDGKRQNTRESRTNSSGGIDQYYVPPVSAIERIEIVRGPMSALHGSDAMGGVINIITKPVADKWTGSMTLEAKTPQDSTDSSERQLSFYTSAPVITDKLGLQVWGRKLYREASEDPNGASERSLNDLHGRATWTPLDDQQFSAELGWTEMDTDPRLNKRSSAALGYEGVIKGWDVTSNLFHEHAGRVTDSSDRKPKIDNTVLDSKASRAFDLLGNHQYTFGGQAMRSALTDQNPGLADTSHHQFSNYQWALFAEDNWEITPDVTLTLGGRHTHDERFGGEFTPRVYALWQVFDGIYLSGGVSTGYRTPELRDSVEGYYTTTNRGAAVIEGTPDLQPEKSTNYEAGLRFERGAARFTATAFHTDFKNKIDSRDTGGTITLDGTSYDLYEYYNIGEARLQGVELTAGYDITPDLEVSGSYTYTHSQQLTGDLKGQPLARTPKHSASVRIDWDAPLEGLNIWGAAHYIGDSINALSTSRGSSAVEHEGYTTLDIGANYALNERVSMKAAVYNLADMDIENDVHGKTLNGRTFWTALTVSF